MTRKDYVLIAGALSQVYRSGEEGIEQHTRTCEVMGDALAQDNPRFDKARFLKACGVAV